MNICICRPLLARLLVVIVAAVLALAPVAWGGGVVTKAAQADLQAALNGGGTVTFGVAGVITLTNTMIIAQDTVLNAAGLDVTISGGNAVRLFQVNSNVAFSVTGLTLANGEYTGANGQYTGANGQDGFGAAIFNQGGTVNLTGCTLTNHSVTGGNGATDNNRDPTEAGGMGLGGAVLSVNGVLHLTNCLVAASSAIGGIGAGPDNEFQAAPDGHAFGGAICVIGGAVSLVGVVLRGNTAAGLRPGEGTGGLDTEYPGGSGVGGALYVTNAVCYLGRCTFTGNLAIGSGNPGTSVYSPSDGGLGGAFGGGVCLDLGASVAIEACSFSTNVSQGQGFARYVQSGVGLGGALYNRGSLQVSQSSFWGNGAAGGTSAGSASGRGGGIFSTGELVLNGCMFAANGAGGGGGIFIENSFPTLPGDAAGGGVWSSGSLLATNSTWATNSAVSGNSGFGTNGGQGGGICVAGGQAALVNVTIAANQAQGGLLLYSTNFGLTFSTTNGGPSQGGGLCATNGVVTVRNSIIANSTEGGDVWGVITDGGYNICSDGTAGFSAASSYNQTNPMLGPLADNGGPTETMALLAGSPALDAIPSGFPPVDQCGTSRPQGPRADIGAFEALAPGSGPFILSQPQGASVSTGANVTFTVVGAAAAPLAYQWFNNGVAIAGATNSSLPLTNVQPASAGAYWVGLTAAGVETNSQTAFLIVDSMPLIVSWPTSLVVSVGGRASFTVLAEGPSLAYQWWHNDVLISGATNPTLVIESALAGAQGTYKVGVSNFAGSAVSPGFQLSFDASALAILAPPPPSSSAGIWDVVTLSVTATGVPPITYQWQSNGTNVPGATNGAFTFMVPATGETGSYSVQVTNAYGDITVSAAVEVYYDYTWTALAGSPRVVGEVDGTGSAAQFESPDAIAVDSSGNCYVTDYYGDTIRKISPGGVVITLAAQFNGPSGVAVDAVGNVYVADTVNDTIRKIAPGGVVTTLAGSPGLGGSADGTGSAARFSNPSGLALDGAGNIYVADFSNQTIRKVTPAGVVTTLAGSPGNPGGADGTGSAAQFYLPVDVAVDGMGNVYVADEVNAAIRKVSPAGVVTTLAGSPNPGGVAVDAVGNVYVAAGDATIRKITPAGLVSTLAGSPNQRGSTLGSSSAVRFWQPVAVAVDARGVVYVADMSNQWIVKGVPPAPPSLVGGSYALAALAGQTNSLAAAALLAACTAPQGDLLAVSAVSPTSAQGGVVQLGGSTITYTPATGFVGADSFTYTVFDSRGASAQGTVAVAVTPAGIAATLAITLVPSNSVAIRFAGVAGMTYNVQTSTDLVHWTDIGAASPSTSGSFEFIDTNANLVQARYYRTRVP